MKKTTRIKSAALVLVILMMVQLLSTSGIAMIASAAQEGVSYTADFSSGDWDALVSSGNWSVEPMNGPGNNALPLQPVAPTVSDGALKFDSKDSVFFNWTNVIGGTNNYDSSKRYVFEFDLKITNSGNGYTWSSNSASYTRTLFVGFGGWFNQIEANTNASQFRAGDTYSDYTASAFENKTLHCEITLEGSTATTVVFNQDNTILSSGSRNNSSYASMTAQNGAMQTLAIRCEDGAFELDNFSFEVKGAQSFDSNSTPISVPTGKQAVYTAKVNFVPGETAKVTFGSKELFDISNTGMKVCGTQLIGTYGAGEYGIKLYINPTQKMVLTEITLPGGGIIRRGADSFLGGSAVTVSATNSSRVSGVGVTYQDISVAQYTLTNSAPSPFNANIYNIVSSFSEASSNRLFAFTTKSSFSESATMVVKYREKGAEEWLSVDAVKAVENTVVDAEDYFKAEISGLKAGTEYEYKVGKKGASSTSSWSDTYSFTTAPKSIKEFSFIAIGDPQGYEWSHFKYAKAALDEAIKAVPSPAFIFNAGDIVDSGFKPAEWKLYFKALGTYGTNYANFTAIGNHDTKNDENSNLLTTADKNNYFSFYFNHPDAPEDALQMSETTYNKLSNSGKVQVNNFNETVYSYNYGDAHFVVLNSGTYVNKGNETYPDDRPIIEAQRKWLEKDLEANKDAKWTIIMLHEALYHRKGGKQDRNYIVDIIDKYKVDLVLEGHSHLVTRTYPMANGKIVTKSSPDLIEKGTGTIYMTIGSTTPGHDTLDGANVELMQTIITPATDQPAYTTVTVRGTDLILTTKQVNGLVLDTFTIRGTEEFGPDDALDDGNGDENDDGNNSTNQDENKAPATTQPSTEETTEGGASTEPTTEEKGGCGNTVGIAGLALVTALGTCAVFATKKKEH